jgi:signal transduction histidine kinase
LTAVRSLVQFLRDSDELPSNYRGILGGVIAEVDRVDRTVGSLLSLSKPPLFVRRPIDGLELVTGAAMFVEPYARQRGVSLTVDAGPAASDLVGDEQELRGVLVNVLINACQACARGDHITISTPRLQAASETGFVDIVVTDTGQGIPPELLARVCEPFVTTKPGGTGLGLAMCQAVVNKHGGQLIIASTVGVGTEVTIRLKGE